MILMGVDAGCTVSSFVIFDSKTQALVDKGLDVPNDVLLKRISTQSFSVFAFERIASFGFPVGKEVLDTAEWNGRFRHAAEIRKGTIVFPATRKQVVVAHTGNAKGGDSAIRTAMIERFGKQNLKGVVRDLWSSLAIACYAGDHLQSEVSATSYEDLGFLSAAPPERSIGLYCDKCRVRWTGCQDAAECPRCGDLTAWDAWMRGLPTT